MVREQEARTTLGSSARTVKNENLDDHKLNDNDQFHTILTSMTASRLITIIIIITIV